MYKGVSIRRAYAPDEIQKQYVSAPDEKSSQGGGIGVRSQNYSLFPKMESAPGHASGYVYHTVLYIQCMNMICIIKMNMNKSNVRKSYLDERQQVHTFGQNFSEGQESLDYFRVLYLLSRHKKVKQKRKVYSLFRGQSCFRIKLSEFLKDKLLYQQRQIFFFITFIFMFIDYFMLINIYKQYNPKLKKVFFVETYCPLFSCDYRINHNYTN